MMFGPPAMTAVVSLFSMPMAAVDYGATTTTAEGELAGDPLASRPTVGHYFPANGDDIERLNLQSPGAKIEVHTPFPDLVIAQQGSDQRGSLLLIQGKTYEVMALGRWWEQAGAEGYQQAWAQEVTR